MNRWEWLSEKPRVPTYITGVTDKMRPPSMSLPMSDSWLICVTDTRPDMRAGHPHRESSGVAVNSGHP